MSKKRFVHIDYLEVLAIFFVLLYHSTLYSYDFLISDDPVYYLRYFVRTVLSTGAPLFFMANGYLLFSKDLNLHKHILKIIKLIAVTLIWAVITLILLQIIRQEFFSLLGFIKALWELKLGWINHLWYMGALICIYVFFPIIKNAYDNNDKLFYYFTAISAILTFGNRIINQLATVATFFALEEPMVIQSINFFHIFNPYSGWYGYSIVYFCTGGILCRFKDRIESISALKRNIVAMVGILLSCTGLFGTGILYSKLMGSLWDVVWAGYDTIFTFLNAIFVFALCLNFKREKRFVRVISNNTLGVYFTHVIIIQAISPYIVEYVWLKNFTSNLLFAVLVIIICLTICGLMKKIPIVSKLVE